MILQNMTLDEIRKELFEEVEVVRDTFKRTFLNKFERAFKKHKQENRRKNISNFHKCYEMRTPRKNRFIVIVKKSPVSNENLIVVVSYHSNYKNFRGYLVNPDESYMMVYNEHFLRRYNEREKLGIDNIVDILKHYIARNSATYTQGVDKIVEGVYKAVSVTANGYLLGVFDAVKNITVFNTYLSKSELTAGQKEEFKHLHTKALIKNIQNLRANDNADIDLSVGMVNELSQNWAFKGASKIFNFLLRKSFS